MAVPLPSPSQAPLPGLSGHTRPCLTQTRTLARAPGVMVERDRGAAGNTHSAEGICARGGAPGGAAHGQILALLAVAAAFRATRRRHNLGGGAGEEQSLHERGARPAGAPQHCTARGGQGTGLHGSPPATRGLLVAQDPPRLGKALEWPLEGGGSKESYLWEEKRGTKRDRGKD